MFGRGPCRGYILVMRRNTCAIKLLGDDDESPRVQVAPSCESGAPQPEVPGSLGDVPRTLGCGAARRGLLKGALMVPDIADLPTRVCLLQMSHETAERARMSTWMSDPPRSEGASPSNAHRYCF